MTRTVSTQHFEAVRRAQKKQRPPLLAAFLFVARVESLVAGYCFFFCFDYWGGWLDFAQGDEAGLLLFA